MKCVQGWVISRHFIYVVMRLSEFNLEMNSINIITSVLLYMSRYVYYLRVVCLYLMLSNPASKLSVLVITIVILE